MKKIYIYASIALLGLGISSCKKELTQNPYNAVNSEDAFKTPDDFSNALRGAYAAYRSTTNFAVYYGGQDGGAMASTPDILADNLILNQQGRKSQQTFFDFKYQPNNTWDLWGNAYAVILRANFILANIDHLGAGDFKNNIQGEALAVRALAHFDLLRTYAKSYTSATDADLGVPYVTSTDPNALPARDPDKKCYDLVVADFEKAATLIGADNGVGRMDKAAVEGLLSRVYLYMGQWQKVVDAATSAINTAPDANKLADTVEFPKIWLDASERDVLFKVKILDGDNVQIGVGYEQASPAGVKAEYSPDYALTLLYTTTDTRKRSYIGQTVLNTVKYNYIKKYFGRAAGAANVVDFKVIRMGEVYLNRAEAYYNLTKPADALADLNTLRANRYSDDTPGAETGQALYNAIQLQRRLELAFEGARFFDIKRLNLPVQRSSFGDKADGSGIAASVKTVPANSKLFELPIPLAETNANKNIKQNDY
ncbi:Starch-binding associating with outer membrane [Mucilaginibacter pineti]|uniref:Starch-binding associating with outer membrane n=1 Tax=Mucilaginibacter pineti TaxID=1391627 RepID=A0A1G6XVP9_9SPHI|nr:RagB/SusD family nutrient uptake outer membrane protein [Mucilaginibacter pineti]SDD82051.1 Starch-binding associating with outer membrane [Mucilaginibacter pineti]